MEPDAPTATAPEPPSPDPRGRRSKVPFVIGGAVLLGIVAFLAIGVFGVHTLFFDDEVSEDGPTFASGASAAPADPEPGPVADGSDAGTEVDPGADATTTTAAPATTVPEVVTAATGTFRAVDHPGEGTVNLLTDGTQTFVRFEDDFSTDNGPDLFAVVYVDGELIELGVLKGNLGSQNYELPADIDPASVDQVGVWCKRFDSTFTIADVA